MILFKNKTFYLFLVLLAHISLLDFFFVTSNGPVFLFDKSVEIKTIITHLVIIVVSVGFYVAINSSANYYRRINTKISDMTWVLWSVFMIVAIGFVLI